MGTIADKDREQLKTIFEALIHPVHLTMFTQEFECEFCRMTRELLAEVAGLSEKISLEVFDFVKDKEKVDKHRIDKIPAVILSGDRDYGIRFFGIPGGYEFTTLVQDILIVSRRDHGLSPEVLSILSGIDKPVHIQVMISPGCPYCAQAVHAAHRFAMAVSDVTADMVETTEFPYLATKYNVHGVPKVVINEKHSFTGSMPEKEFAQEIVKALKM